MTRSVLPFRAIDLAALQVQPAQQGELGWDSGRYGVLDLGRELEAAGNGFTLRLDEKVVFCGGAQERHVGYATLWALFSIDKPKVPVWLTRTVRGFVAELPHRRVDAMVAASHIGACGWARLIGLREECLLREACDDGGDMIVFRRV